MVFVSLKSARGPERIFVRADQIAAVREAHGVDGAIFGSVITLCGTPHGGGEFLVSEPPLRVMEVLREAHEAVRRERA